VKQLTNIAFYFVFAVVLAGSIVRMTGSGMGCPDWPKCFGLLIPPTSEEEIRWATDTDYSEGRMVIENDTLWYATSNHISEGWTFSAENWAPHPHHNYSEFNPTHTWIEYLNRLTGALAGIPVLILFILTIRSRKTRAIILSSATLTSLLFVAWLGKKVVDGNLIPFSITIHTLGALSILACLIFMMQHFDGMNFTIKKSTRTWMIVGISLAILQFVLGTQVRELVDHFMESGVARISIIDSLPEWWKIHRSAAWIVLAAHLAWAMRLYKMPQLKSYAITVFAILLGQMTTGILFTQIGMPAFAQPVHIVLGFALILVDLRAILATKVY
jgi:cytochrome c oxidase assembly protein subunit 15